MVKYNSPFSVGYRKPSYITEDDPRAKSSSYKNRIGREVVVLEKIKESELEDGQYWISVLSKEKSHISGVSTNSLQDSYFFGIDYSENYNFDPIYPKGVFGQYTPGKNLVFKKTITFPEIEFVSVECRSGVLLDDKDTLIFVGRIGTKVGYTDFTNPNMFIASYSLSTKQIKWAKKIYRLNSSYLSSITTKIKLSPDGYIYVGTTINAPGGFGVGGTVNRALVLKIDVSGNIIWQRSIDAPVTFGGATQADCPLSDIEVDNSGNVYIFGNDGYFYTQGVQRVYFAKLDKDGNRIWINSYTDGGRGHSPKFISKDKEDNLYITFGQILGGDASFLLKINKDDGEVIWAKKTYQSSEQSLVCINNYNYICHCIAVAGFLKFTVLNTDGTVLATKTIYAGSVSPGDYFDMNAYDMKMNSSGNVYIAGRITNQGTMEMYLPADMSLTNGTYEIYGTSGYYGVFFPTAVIMDESSYISNSNTNAFPVNYTVYTEDLMGSHSINALVQDFDFKEASRFFT